MSIPEADGETSGQLARQFFLGGKWVSCLLVEFALPQPPLTTAGDGFWIWDDQFFWSFACFLCCAAGQIMIRPCTFYGVVILRPTDSV